MNGRPESEDGRIERLRAEVEVLRGTLRRLECAGPPCGYRCPYCSHEPPLFNPLSTAHQNLYKSNAYTRNTRLAPHGN